jgi:hypothetical protein
MKTARADRRAPGLLSVATTAGIGGLLVALVDAQWLATAIVREDQDFAPDSMDLGRFVFGLTVGLACLGSYLAFGIRRLSEHRPAFVRGLGMAVCMGYAAYLAWRLSEGTGLRRAAPREIWFVAFTTLGFGLVVAGARLMPRATAAARHRPLVTALALLAVGQVAAWIDQTQQRGLYLFLHDLLAVIVVSTSLAAARALVGSRGPRSREWVTDRTRWLRSTLPALLGVLLLARGPGDARLNPLERGYLSMSAPVSGRVLRAWTIWRSTGLVRPPKIDRLFPENTLPTHPPTPSSHHRFGAVYGRAPPDPGPPTVRGVIVILVDTLRPDVLDEVVAPNLVAFRDDSLWADRAFAPHDDTASSISAFMTGIHSATLRYLPGREVPLLPGTLHSRGIRVFCRTTRVHFLTQWDALWDGDRTCTTSQNSRTDVVAVREFLRAQAGGDEPFFAFVHFLEPHWPWGDSNQARAAGKSDRERYAIDVQTSDRHVGAVLEAIDELGLDSETAVAVISDHGESLGEHGYQGHGAGDLFSATTKIVLGWRAPGIRAGRIVPPVSLLDLTATIYDALGQRPPLPLVGEPLPGLRNAGQRSVVTEWAIRGRYAISGPRSRLIRDLHSGAEQFFDSVGDPRELSNRIADPRSAAEAARLRSTLDDWLGFQTLAVPELRRRLTP